MHKYSLCLYTWIVVGRPSVRYTMTSFKFRMVQKCHPCSSYSTWDTERASLPKQHCVVLSFLMLLGSSCSATSSAMFSARNHLWSTGHCAAEARCGHPMHFQLTIFFHLLCVYWNVIHHKSKVFVHPQRYLLNNKRGFAMNTCNNKDKS